MSLHGSLVSAAMKPFHENLEKRFKEMKIKTVPFKKVGSVKMLISERVGCVSLQQMYGRLLPLTLKRLANSDFCEVCL